MKQKSIRVLNILINTAGIITIVLGMLYIGFDDVAVLNYLFSAAVIFTVICSIVMAIAVKKKTYAIITAVVGIILIISTITNYIIPTAHSFLIKLIGDVGILILVLLNDKSE